MTACLGQYKIEDIRWAGRQSLRVEITTELEDRYIQMYADRKLIGVSTAAGDLVVIGLVQPTHCPTPITIALVDAADKDTDLSQLLPQRPWNLYTAHWGGTFTDDTRWFAISSSSAPGEEVDYETVLARVQYIGDGNYQFDLPAITACGPWKYGVVSLDDAEPNGNPCAMPAEQVVNALVYPPDVLSDDTGQRFRVVQDGSTLTIAFDYDWAA